MKFRKLLSLSFVSLLLVGCKNEEQPEESKKYKPNPSGINLVENGTSEYKIVYEANSTQTILTAANELQTFIYESTGVSIPYAVDTGEEFNEQNKVISIGDTKIFEGSGLSITQDMHKTGYYLKRFGNTLIINALDVNGVICAVYDMLYYTMGLKFYSVDEYVFDKYENLPLMDFDLKFIPFIDVRAILQKSLTKQHAQRLRLYKGDGKGQWVTFAHTVVTTYLPFEKYGKDHPEWYNSNKNQVCYSNEEMRHEMCKRIEECILNNPDGQYVMIGHEDNWDMCTCDNCKAEMALYGGYAGQELMFTNKVSEEVDKWLNDTQDGRKVDYVFFAYQTSQTPPVKTKDEGGKQVAVLDANGNYQPYYDNFNIRDDVIVIYCPIDADFSVGFNETENTAQYQQLKGWSDIFHGSNLYNNILIWSYSLAVRDYFIPFNQFGAFKNQVKFYKDLGACYVMDQSNHDSGIPCFESLKLYCEAQLMYDNDQDYNELAYDFIDHYYGPAAETFKKYFNFFRTYFAANNISGSIWQVLSSASLWPIETLDLLMSYFDECFEAIEPLRTSDYERFTVLNDRLRRERLTPIFLLLRNYLSLLTQEQKEEYIIDFAKYCNKYEIVETGESQNNIGLMIEEWENTIFKR